MGRNDLEIAEAVAEEAVTAYRAMRRKYRVALFAALILAALHALAILWRCAL